MARNKTAQGGISLRRKVTAWLAAILLVTMLSLLSLQHPAFFISIIISRGKCNCKKAPVFVREPVLAGNVPGCQRVNN